MSRLQRQISLVLGAVFCTIFGLTVIGELLALESGIWTDTGTEIEAENGTSPETDDLAPVSVGGAVLVLLGSAAFVLAGIRESITVGGREVSWWQVMNFGFCMLAFGWIGPLVSAIQTALMPALIPLAVAVATLGFGLVRLGREQPTAVDDSDPFPIEVAMTVLVGGILVIFSIMYVQLFFSLH
ncbi:hypothetical protein C482_06387 [Natrialba chahannaoensis JCM 10990]|uniref:Uncharacterized protein n=1 Tax=Natrialba chahannaoensis JCM 10990 TaxID=1227492 RepID=M0AUN9_9EURY|nr:hypothetical protein [Natrialba chahannaoensis]ELZ01658.1 hypothetical protein C482_06387 [Natrialba chahannaoensis JCM 10990]